MIAIRRNTALAHLQEILPAHTRQGPALSKHETGERMAGTVFIVDGDVSTHRLLASLLGHDGLRTETFLSAREFLCRAPTFHPCCLVLDTFLPDCDGLSLQQQLSIRWPELPLIFLASRGTVTTGVQAIKAGAVEFLVKPSNDTALRNAITAALARSASSLRRGFEMHRCRDGYASLSPRERQVMGLVLAGLMNKQIAHELGISEVTVKAHRGKIMRKMGSRNLVGLLRCGILLQLPSFPGRPELEATPCPPNERIPVPCVC